MVTLSKRALSIVAAPNVVLAAMGAPAGSESQASGAGGAPPAKLTSEWELANPGCVLSRDGGVSSPLPNNPDQSLWLFGDTGWRNPDGACGTSIPGWPSLGTHGAISINSPGQVPTVSEIPTPGLHNTDGPAVGPLPNDRNTEKFFPTPDGLKNPDGSDCDHPVSWPGAITIGPDGPMRLYDGTTPVDIDDGADLLFIAFQDVCLHEGDMLGQRTNMAAYDPDRNSIVAIWEVFTSLPDPTATVPWYESLSSPMFHDGHMYTFASRCDEREGQDQDYLCTSGRTYLLRVPNGGIHNKDAYKWWTPAEWTDDPTEAETLVDASWASVHDYSATGDDLVLIDQTSLAGDYRIFQADEPAGPWTYHDEGRSDSCSGTSWCYYFVGHPEFSTPDDALYSIYDGTDGEIKVDTLGSL